MGVKHFHLSLTLKHGIDFDLKHIDFSISRCNLIGTEIPLFYTQKTVTNITHKITNA